MYKGEIGYAVKMLRNGKPIRSEPSFSPRGIFSWPAAILGVVLLCWLVDQWTSYEISWKS
jgi:hypothetical protein